MRRVFWHVDAVTDLDEVYLYSKVHWGATAARRYVAGLRKLTERLGRLPRMGRQWDAMSSVRRVRHERHVVFYEVVEDEVHILAVRHERQAPVDAR